MGKGKGQIEIELKCCIGRGRVPSNGGTSSPFAGDSGFPTLQVLEQGRVKDEYAGDRSLQSIVAFALDHAKSAPEPKVKKAKEPAKKAKAPPKKRAVRKT